jgi:hypothetical protein
MLPWVLLWVVLVLLAGALFALLGRRLWLKGRALTVEIGEASERLTAVLAALNDLADQSGQQPAPDVATPDGAREGRRDRRARPH